MKQYTNGPEAEIERLRALRFRWEDRALVAERKLHYAEAEVERLREQNTAVDFYNEMVKAQAEVERLRSLYDLHTGGNECPFEAEVERLRAYEVQVGATGMSVSDLLAEVERLRAEKEAAAQMYAQTWLEVERLRALYEPTETNQ